MSKNSVVTIHNSITVDLDIVVEDILRLVECDANVKLNIEDRYTTAINLNKLLSKHFCLVEVGRDSNE